MKIKDCTETKGGHPWRFYADGAGGAYPVHGAYYWQGNWYAGEWTPSGKFHYSNHINSEYDLDLRDWRDQIPWDRLIDEIIVVEKTNMGTWWGFSDKREDVYNLACIKMPNGPVGEQAIARRPE